MCKTRLRPFIRGMFMAVTIAAGFFQTTLAQRSGSQIDPDFKQPRTVTFSSMRGGSQDQAQRRFDLELLTRAENRADALRAQLGNLQMREMELQARIEELDYQMKPESIQRTLAYVGSARPMDELRANLRARLESEKSRTNTQLETLASTRMKLETALRGAEAECVRLRQRLGLSNDAQKS